MNSNSMIEYRTPYEFHILWFLYPSWPDLFSFVWDETKYICKCKLLIEAPIIFLRRLHFVDTFFPLSLIHWFDKTFLFIFENDHSYAKPTVSSFFLTESLTLGDSGKFEKNWGQICYCVLTPSIATSSFLTAWKLVFFPGGPGPNFHMVQAFYGVSLAPVCATTVWEIAKICNLSGYC